MAINKTNNICCILIAVTACGLTMFSCKNKNINTRVSLLCRSWHAVKLENKEYDSFFANSQAYIDTIGKGHDAATNMALYQVANMDSMRQILQSQLDSARKMHADAIDKTMFNFRRDSVAVLTFGGQTDSSRWFFSGADTVVLEDLNQVGGPQIKMEILTLTGDELKLRLQENNATSTVTFHPEGK